jgi:CRP-like cAMP-binding protein
MAASNMEALRKDVMDSYRKGDWKRCIVACKAIHKRFPDNVAITLKLADVFIRGGQKNNAVKAYQRAADTYKESGDFLKAVGVYKMILKFAPDLQDIKAKMEELCSGGDKERNKLDLPKIPLFAELDQDELIEVVNNLKHSSFSLGDMICKLGDDGTSIYVVTEGLIKIFIEGAAGEKIEIAKLGAGDFFGEAGFFTNGKRNASVMAIDDTELLEITKDDFEQIFKKHPRIKDLLESFYKKRVLDKLLVVSPLFSVLSDAERVELLNDFKLNSYNDGDVVIREGDSGDALFLIKQGKAKVTTGDSGNKELVLAGLKEGDFFGEVSLITGKPRTANILADGPLELMELSKNAMMKYLKKYPQIEDLLKSYIKARAYGTISTIMALKDIEAKEGLV